MSSQGHDTIKAALADVCYPKAAEQILQYFRAFFEIPGAPPWPVAADENPNSLRFDESLVGVIAPHIDFLVSQKSYAFAFEPLLEEPPAAHYLILGVGHRSANEWCFDPRGYSTALGEVAGSPELAERLGKEVGHGLLSDPTAYHHEHSIEFPVILLQALSRLRGVEPDFTIAPVLCGGLWRFIMGAQRIDDAEEIDRFAAILREWFEEKSRQGGCRVIVSIDGCHQGPKFNHPYRMDKAQLDDTRHWEEKLWKHIERHDLHGFIDFVGEEGNQRHFDGVGALALLLKMFPEGLQAKRTHYEQWFEKARASSVTFSSGTLYR